MKADGKQTEDLTSFVERMGASKALRVEENLGQGFVRLRVGEAERRQARHDIRCSEDIVIELLRNARDASARRIFVATWREETRRAIVMLDDGEGIPESMHERIFDARVTSKLESVHMDRWGVHGRGMALYSIRENVLEAQVKSSMVGGGTALRITSDTETLPEKTDQSTWPTIERDGEESETIGRGPHNIIRTCCEFALEEQGGCEVYLGSAAEIVATMRSRVRSSLSEKGLLLVKELTELPVCERFRVAADAHELCEAARACGLDMSERTAHRVISGQIKPLPSVLLQIKRGFDNKERAVDLQADRRGLRLSAEDKRAFTNMMERDFDYLAERYYLKLSQSPRIRVSGTRITVTYEFAGED